MSPCISWFGFVVFLFLCDHAVGWVESSENLGGIGDGKTWSKYIARKKIFNYEKEKMMTRLLY